MQELYWNIMDFAHTAQWIRLEVKSQKGSRNHFREDGMLTFVTHANH